MIAQPRVLLTGASGQLGSYLLAELVQSASLLGGLTAWRGPSSDGPRDFPMKSIDLTDFDGVERQVARVAPDVILHAAAMSRIDQCHENSAVARQVNATATAWLVELARRQQARILYVSTDLVFDGNSPPYSETAEPQPTSIYGQTKREGELAVLDYPAGLVARVSLLFGPSRCGRPNFFDQQRKAMRQGNPCRLFADEWRTPLAFHCAARALTRLALSERVGLVHVGGPERLSRLEMGERLAKFLDLPQDSIVATRRDDVVTPESRPRDVSLDSSSLRREFPQLAWPDMERALAELGVRPSDRN